MRRSYKIVIFSWPVLLLLYLASSMLYEQSIINKKLFDANNLSWEHGQDKIIFHIKKTSSGELDTYELTAIKNNKQLVINEHFVIDKDMFGGGFIKAVQTDTDQDFEVLVWGIGETRQSYLLNYSAGKITKQSFNELPDDIKQLAINWYQAYIKSPMSIFFFGILALSYYFFALIIWLFVKVVRHFKEKN